MSMCLNKTTFRQFREQSVLAIQVKQCYVTVKWPSKKEELLFLQNIVAFHKNITVKYHKNKWNRVAFPTKDSSPHKLTRTFQKTDSTGGAKTDNTNFKPYEEHIDNTLQANTVKHYMSGRTTQHLSENQKIKGKKLTEQTVRAYRKSIGYREAGKKLSNRFNISNELPFPRTRN